MRALRAAIAATACDHALDVLGCIAGNSGSVTVSRPMRSAFGNCPSR